MMAMVTMQLSVIGRETTGTGGGRELNISPVMQENTAVEMLGTEAAVGR